MTTRRTRRTSSAFRGGLLGGVLGSAFARPIERAARWAAKWTAYTLVIGALLVYGWWRAQNTATHIILTLLVTALLVWWADRRWADGRLWEWIRAPHRLPRTAWSRHTGRCWWVYDIAEYRDRNDQLLTLADGERRDDAVLHRVYIGKANVWDNRALGHRGPGADMKPWWHDELLIRLRQCWSEAEAYRVEAALIGRWARPDVPLHLRPRENRVLNPTYDANRAARLNLPAIRDEVAA